MKPISNLISKAIADRYDEPYHIGRSITQGEATTLVIPVFLPGVPYLIAEGFIFIGTYLDGLLTLRIRKKYDTDIIKTTLNYQVRQAL